MINYKTIESLEKYVYNGENVIVNNLEPWIVYRDNKWEPAYLWSYAGVSERFETSLTKENMTEELWDKLVEMYPPDLNNSTIAAVWLNA